ncbi:MAG: EAL domain-containing protein [candidate division WOR-3 bacterium]
MKGFDPIEFKKIIDEYTFFKSVMQDGVTKLPTFLSVLNELKERLENEKKLGIFSIKILEGEKIESEYGFEMYDEWILKISEILKNIIIKKFTPLENPLLLINAPRGDHFLIVFSSLKEGKTFEEEIEEILLKEVPISCKVKYIELAYDPVTRAEREIMRAFEKLEIERLREESKIEIRLRALFKGTLKRADIKTVFQPIYDIENNEIFGYEALSRGPKGTEIEEPLMLFSMADALDELLKLESICHWKALLSYKKLNKKEKYLFLNTSSKILQEKADEFIQEFIKIIDEMNYDRRKIVIEITERYAITDFKALVKNINYLKEEGFLISIDDVGVGYSSLHTLAELKPDFLKYDMILVRDMHKDLIKQRLLEMVLNFGKSVNTPVIAEGVEKKEEYETLLSLGVKYAQGFYLSKPLEVDI